MYDFCISKSSSCPIVTLQSCRHDSTWCLIFHVLFWKRVRGSIRFQNASKHLKPRGRGPNGFLVFERLETWWNPKQEVLKLLLQQRELVEIIILISFLNSNILFETWNVNLSPTCCLLVCDIFLLHSMPQSMPYCYWTVRDFWASILLRHPKIVKKRKIVWPAPFRSLPKIKANGRLGFLKIGEEPDFPK